MATIHFVDGRSGRPLCGARANQDRQGTCDPRSVTCADCGQLVVQASGTAGSLTAPGMALRAV